jgi:Sulfotransferase family
MLNPLSPWLASKFWRDCVLPRELTEAHRIRPALRAIEQRWPRETDADQDDEAPIFILSAGWGTGSTLLQRLVVSGGTALLWGEPFDHAAIVQRLAQTLHPIGPDWPKVKYFADRPSSDQMAASWIANLTPDFDHLRRAHRLFLLNWLKHPALVAGYERWGMKETRLTIDHAQYLKWLFPNARFLFIYRDVMDSYLSCKGVNWYSVWPDYRARRVSLFAHHWRLLAEGFLADAASVDGVLIRYEDLAAGRVDIELLSGYLDAGTLDARVLDRKIGSRRKRHTRLNPLERVIITTVAGGLRATLGYS